MYTHLLYSKNLMMIEIAESTRSYRYYSVLFIAVYTVINFYIFTISYIYRIGAIVPNKKKKKM